MKNALLHDVQNPHQAICTADCRHARVRGKVHSEHWLWQVDQGTERFHTSAARWPHEEFCLVLLRTSGQDHRTPGILAALGCEEHAGALRRRGLPLHGLRDLGVVARAEVPELKGFVGAPRASQDLRAVRGEVDGVAAEVAIPQRADGVAATGVPNLDSVVPAARKKYVRVLGMVLEREDTIGVASRFLHVATLQSLDQSLGGLVVHADQPIPAGGGELAAVSEVVQAKELVTLLGDSV
mmetsp:Transcript_158932/g.509840  ORF Transcript_158932/g.509840 Transcript_158932/m.509840 type:complete len:239 (-) Transcript_158932:522-1238(-)